MRTHRPTPTLSLLPTNTTQSDSVSKDERKRISQLNKAKHPPPPPRISYQLLIKWAKAVPPLFAPFIKYTLKFLVEKYPVEASSWGQGGPTLIQLKSACLTLQNWILVSALSQVMQRSRIRLPVQMLEMWVRPLGREDPLEEMAAHSSILAWRIPWTEKPGGLQSMGSQNWTQLKRLSMHACPFSSDLARMHGLSQVTA